LTLTLQIAVKPRIAACQPHNVMGEYMRPAYNFQDSPLTETISTLSAA